MSEMRNWDWPPCAQVLVGAKRVAGEHAETAAGQIEGGDSLDTDGKCNGLNIIPGC